MKTVEQFLYNIFGDAEWSFGEFQEVNPEAAKDIVEQTKSFIQEAIKADRINLLKHVKTTYQEYRGEINTEVVDDSIINAPNIELL